VWYPGEAAAAVCMAGTAASLPAVRAVYPVMAPAAAAAAYGYNRRQTTRSTLLSPKKPSKNVDERSCRTCYLSFSFFIAGRDPAYFWTSALRLCNGPAC